MPPRAKRKNGSNVSKTKNVILVENQDSTRVKSHDTLSMETQQTILNVYRTAFPMLEAPDELQEHIKKVKSHLYNRDFTAAFSESCNLEAYAARWSAARSLGYASIFLNLDLKSLLQDTRQLTIDMNIPQVGGDITSPFSDQIASHIVCIGGGAGGELISLATAYKKLGVRQRLTVTAVDIADWSEPVSKLATAIYEVPKLSTHASEAAKARPENQSLLDKPDSVMVSFLQQDVLTWDAKTMHQTLKNASLCTIMFTLNELFSASLQKTTSFLLHLTNIMISGTYLLIVDSPGSYSEIELQKQKPDQEESLSRSEPKKRYPMKWLLDHTLLTIAKEGETPVWEKLKDEESLWFRIDSTDREKLSYPIELENMRYQLHLYRKL